MSARATGSGSVVVRVRLGARTGLPRWELSTAGLAVVPAALRARERGVEPVADREAELGEDRGVVLAPVGKEVPDVALRLGPEPAHQPPPFLPAHSSVDT